MKDEIKPGPSAWITSKDLSDDWRLHIYSDEVFWMYKPHNPKLWHFICRFPFVDGYFLAKLTESDETTDDGYDIPETCYPVAGPFKTLRAAMAATIVLGPMEEE